MIYPGERVLIAGPSGSGKSTLAGCINGLNPFSNPGACTGTLTVDGVDAPHSSLFELSAHVGTVLQDPDGQFIGLTVGEDIAFALENSCTPQDEMYAITRHAAELVGIENHLGYAPHELSGGQKQRVSLAGVMVDQVKILLFDEPLANLDPATGKQAIEPFWQTCARMSCSRAACWRKTASGSRCMSRLCAMPGWRSLRTSTPPMWTALCWTMLTPKSSGTGSRPGPGPPRSRNGSRCWR